MSIKEDWIARQLQTKEDEFTESRTLTFVVGTWNVNSKFPPPNTTVASWLRLSEHEADIYAIGLQEIDMTAGALLAEETKISEKWTVLLTNTIQQCTNKYYTLVSRQLVGIYLILFIKEEHKDYLTEVKCNSEGVGIMGMLGNKGAISCRFKLYSTSMCFITSHFAPHTDAIQRRNQNFSDLSRRCEVEDHDFIFWFGDLNYRLTIPDAEARQAIADNNLEHLLAHDQLNIERKHNRVFEGYIEGPITFLPSYKFDSGTNIYDTSEKKRTPSYTDRVLWKERGTNVVKQKYYLMHDQYVISDHKPIISAFDVPVKVIQPEKYKQLYRDLIKTLDKLENDMLPEIKISNQLINFENIRYLIPQSRILSLENTGQVVCEFMFVPKPSEESAHKPWLKIEPFGGIIMPNEKAEIKITVFVDSTTVATLTDDTNIDDILILHLKNGRDHFISVTGYYEKSVYGMRLENEVPKCMWRLIDWLYRYGIKEEDLFQEAGVTDEVNLIRLQLDHDQPFSESVSVHSVAEAFLSFLEALAEPVIPYRFYRMSIEASSNANACIHLVTKLNRVHFNTFHYIMAFLREVLKHSNDNLLNIDTIAIIFSRVIIRPPPSYSYSQANSQQELRSKALFIKHFLSSNHHWTREELVIEDEK
jgi:phosphatidylinositol-bisphosphatase